MYPTVFPRHQWYAAARREEIDEEPLGRTILGERIVFFNDAAGEPVALEDRCVHRSLPLSLGWVRGGTLTCRYHGIAYDGTGAVVDIPCQSHIPRGRAARLYPVYANAHLVWVWVGDPARADPALVPDQSWIDSGDWAVVGGTLHVSARAQLMNENLTDLSHVSYLHAGTIGTEDIARAPMTVEVDGRIVRVHRPMPDVECPPFFAKAMGIHGRIARESTAEYVAPSYHVSYVAATPLSEGDGARASRHRAVHCITPETDTTAHYLWLIARDYHRDSPDVDELWRNGAPVVLLEDIVAVEAIEDVLRHGAAHPNEINVYADAGALRAREVLERMIADD